MIRIFFKTLWNQRSRNLLVYIELFIIFLVLSNLTIYMVNMVSILKIKNCYHSDNVVLVRLAPNNPGNKENPNGKILNDLKRYLSSNQLVEAVSISNSATPYEYSLSSSTFPYNEDYKVNMALRDVDIEYKEVMKIDVLKGRWFNESDLGRQVRPVLVDVLVEKEEFEGDAMGKIFGGDNKHEVIGIVDAFKRDDIEKPHKSAFFFSPVMDDKSLYSAEVMIRVKPGKVNEYLSEIEENLFSVLNPADWTIYSLNTLELMQQEQNANNGFKRLVGILLAVFIILNVLLGVVGILWYNVNLRVHEIGVKRAIGNHGRKIIRQLISENLILTFLSALPVVILLIQIPGIRIAELEPMQFILSMVLSIVVLLILVVICSWIPAYMASRIQPADALKYE